MKMEMKKDVVQIPKEPVNGYTVVYWRLSMTSSWIYISETTAVYHVNTPWDEYSSNKGGAPLVDDWMISTKSGPLGRIPGWGNICDTNSNDYFATEKEAIQESIKRLSSFIGDTERRLARLGQMRQEQEAKLPEREIKLISPDAALKRATTIAKKLRKEAEHRQSGVPWRAGAIQEAAEILDMIGNLPPEAAVIKLQITDIGKELLAAMFGWKY